MTHFHEIPGARPLRERLTGLLSALLPQDCLLCGAACGHAPGGNSTPKSTPKNTPNSTPNSSPLCAACTATLPPLPSAQCPVCALPAPAGNICGACLKSAPAYDATIAAWRYAFPVDKLVQSLKFEHRLALAGLFARTLLAGPRPAGDLLVPLPLSAQRLRERGFNQAAEIARPLARALALPLNLFDCRRSKETLAQTSLPWKERRRNVRNAFECSIDLAGKSVIVIDDVMTTGATLDEFARTLKRHGAAKVTNWVVARALKN